MLGSVPAHASARDGARTPLGRLGEPEDIAGIVGFPASDAGRWVTGQTLRAAGGTI